MKLRLNYPLSAVCAAVVLTGCGGGSGGSDPGRQQIELNAAKVSLEPLSEARAANFSRHLRNGLYAASVSGLSNCVNCLEASAPTADTSAGADGNFSTTNTQEAGVDEMDRIKYNGEYLYIAAKPWYDQIDTPIGAPEYIKVMQRQADTSMSEVGRVELPQDMKYVNGLYQHNNKLAAIGNPDFFYGMPGGPAIDIWHPVDLEVNLAVYDVESPQSPELNQFISYDGYLISSRRIDNKLYMVSSFSPRVEGLNYGAFTEADKQANYDKLQATDINDLMPKLTLADNTVRNLVEPEDCYIPEDATSADGYDSIVTLTTVDLDQPNSISSVCINAVTHAIYASTNAIYLLGTTSEEQSVIHKFDLHNNMNYVGAGNVDGMFGWNSPSFRLSEHDGKLRVATTKWSSNGNGPSHRLYVLDAQAQDNKLNVLSQIPNEQRPEPIGKPNEDIYAVRYFGDKAYIVTFERIDPLYVVDLSDANDPFIAGELEIPGFSSYLHPINENLLLGIGQQVDPNRFPLEGGENTTDALPVDEGAKVSLFDVSDPANPTQIGSIVYTDAYTPVEWDHHALTYLPVSETEFRFALPVSFWHFTADDLWHNTSGLHRLQVNVTDNGAELVEYTPILQSPSNESIYINVGDDRSVLHDDVVYYIHGNEVQQGNWHD